MSNNDTKPKEEIERLIKMIKTNQELMGIPKITVPGALNTPGSIEVLGEITLPKFVIDIFEELSGIKDLKNEK